MVENPSKIAGKPLKIAKKSVFQQFFRLILGKNRRFAAKIAGNDFLQFSPRKFAEKNAEKKSPQTLWKKCF